MKLLCDFQRLHLESGFALKIATMRPNISRRASLLTKDVSIKRLLEPIGNLRRPSKNMPTTHSLNSTLKNFVNRQKMFFVATADKTGRVNLSPKGMDTLQIVDNNRIIWLNLSGSGNETAAHVAATGRMTLMFCAFDESPMILRLYGNATVMHPRHKEWESTIKSFPKIAGSRQIFHLTIDLVQTSCGTGVPIMDFKQSRAETELVPFYEEMGDDGVSDYWKRKNLTSLDGKPTGIFEDFNN